MNAFTNYLDRLGSHFLIASMIPSLGLVIACLLVFDPILHFSEAFQIENGIYSLLGISFLVFIPTIIVGFTLTALNTYILKIFEGYVFFHHFPFMRNAHAKKANRLIKQREVLRDQIELLNRKKKKSAEDEQSLEALRTAYDTLVATYDQIYPPPHAGIMPTKFGNILKASEAYSGTRYGIDAVEFWPRLLHVIPSSYKQTIDEARNELSFLVNMSALSVVFYLLCILAILGSAPSPSSANWSKVFENSLRYMLSGGFGLFLNWFFNRAAIFSVADYGMVLRSSYDLFRLDLLEHFRLRSPKDSVEEFQMWKNLRELFVLGQESIEFRPLKYEKRDQKTKVTSGSTKAS